MRWRGMYIAGTGSALPDPVPLAPEVAAGRYDPAEAARTKMVSVTRDTQGLSSLEYAVLAGSAALDDTPKEIVKNLRVLNHAFVSPPGGPPAYNAAAKIHQLLGLPPTVMPSGITNGCAMALYAIEQACYRLDHDAAGAALIAASEVWPPELADPYNSARGLLLADGAGAAVVSNEDGFAAILATASRIDSRLADATRGGESLRYDPNARIDLGSRFNGFAAEEIPVPEYRERRDNLIRGVLEDVLSDAGVTLGEIDAFVLTHSGAHNLERGYFRLIPPAAHKINTAEIGHRIGHVGCADWLIGLDRLRAEGRVKSGHRVLMLGGAGGWVEAAAILGLK